MSQLLPLLRKFHRKFKDNEPIFYAIYISGVKVAEMIVQLADNRDYSIVKFIACEHALNSCQSSSSFIFNFLCIDNH